VTVLIPEPDVVPRRSFVGREDLVAQCMAAWLPSTAPPCTSVSAAPRRRQERARLPPGAGRRAQAPVHHAGARGDDPGDVACTARITHDHRVEYVGSPLLASMLTAGICFFDEIGKVRAGRFPSWRRSWTTGDADVGSGGFSVQAAPEFRFCAALNDGDAAAGGLPGYIDERLASRLPARLPAARGGLHDRQERRVGRERAAPRAVRHWAARRDRLSPRQPSRSSATSCGCWSEPTATLTEKSADAAIALAAEKVYAC